MKLYGIRGSGNGTTIEVHLDLRTTNPDFSLWLAEQGFEDDPFSVFYPEGYVGHMTGRIRVPARRLSHVIPDIYELVVQIVKEARSRNIELYAEVEVMRKILRFVGESHERNLSHLDFSFRGSGRNGGAKADIHVEFDLGGVSDQVRKFFLEHKFYWVSTPKTPYFPPEEIATLQTTTYGSAMRVFGALLANPPPHCKGICLEQKLGMFATDPALPMPEVIEVD